MGFIIREFTKDVDMVLYLFMRTGATAKPCQLESMHPNLTDRVADRECVVKMMPLFLHVFAGEGLHLESDIKESEKVQKAAKQYWAGQKSSFVAHR